MALYDSDHPDVPNLRGLHLYHFAMSNCSQRVRLGLEEKGLAWESHHVNLPANEHVTSDYQRINPNGVVPTLVHDGQVVIESNDILAYLDEHFPEPRLTPEDPAARRAMADHIARASAFQSTIKVLSHELLFRPFRKIGPEEIALYAEKHRDETLVSFLRDYSEAGPAWASRVAEAQQTLAEEMGRLEAALEQAPWLSGDAYGLADVSWVVNVNRLLQAGIDFSAWPKLADWAKRAMSRPAFDAAVASYTP